MQAKRCTHNQYRSLEAPESLRVKVPSMQAYTMNGPCACYDFLQLFSLKGYIMLVIAILLLGRFLLKISIHFTLVSKLFPFAFTIYRHLRRLVLKTSR